MRRRESESAPRRTRTYNPLIKSQRDDSISADSDGTCGDGPDAPSNTPSNELQERPLDPVLAVIVERWDSLPEVIRRAVAAMVGSV